ncbi:FG-GAP repeat domain-containing protein [Streptomyces sp. Ac-502]|uniref:FG-GAP repeat domain-containing protein n=1 Tax=Streptomyces sp. Ac-502 TaxID=3342801 RepID=UPI0038624124
MLTGGPALRETETGGPELVAVSHASWQGGCFGSEQTRTGAVETRVDDLHRWVQQSHLTALHSHVTDVVTSADFNGDGRPDIAAINSSGGLCLYPGNGKGTLGSRTAMWPGMS